MKRNKLIIALFGLLMFSSCEKVVELELNEVDEQIVVDAMVSNIDEYNYVKLSKSLQFYDRGEFSPVEGASVIVTDGNGVAYPLSETSAGYYENASLVGQEYTNYTLKIEVGDQIYEGSTFLPGNSEIDSVVTLVTGGFGGGSGPAEYTAFAYWADDANERNYYRLRSYKNDSLQSNIVITQDSQFNGIPTGSPLFGASFLEGDSARVELMEIDEGTYKYWVSLDQISNPQNQPAAPGNPLSNMSNGAIGYFGGYNIYVDTLRVE